MWTAATHKRAYGPSELCFGFRFDGHLALTLDLSNKLGKLSQW